MPMHIFLFVCHSHVGESFERNLNHLKYTIKKLLLLIFFIITIIKNLLYSLMLQVGIAEKLIMFGFNVRTRQNATNSPRTPRGTGSPATLGSPRTPRGPSSPSTAVGEIDTRAPFQSVRAAVNLFGDVASPKNKPALVKKTKTAEEVIIKVLNLNITPSIYTISLWILMIPMTSFSIFKTVFCFHS